MWVAGIDGCHVGWVCFKVELASLSNSEKGQDRESKEPLRRRATYSGHSGFHGMHERAKLAGGKLEVWSKLDSGTPKAFTTDTIESPSPDQLSPGPFINVRHSDTRAK